MKNHYFWVPLEAKEKAKWHQKSISIAIGKLLVALRGAKCKVDSWVAEFGGPGAPRRTRTPSPQPGRGLDKMHIPHGSSTGVFSSELLESGVPLYLGNWGHEQGAKHASHRAAGGTVADLGQSDHGGTGALRAIGPREHMGA